MLLVAGSSCDQRSPLFSGSILGQRKKCQNTSYKNCQTHLPIRHPEAWCRTNNSEIHTGKGGSVASDWNCKITLTPAYNNRYDSIPAIIKVAFGHAQNTTPTPRLFLSLRKRRAVTQRITIRYLPVYFPSANTRRNPTATHKCRLKKRTQSHDYCSD